MSKKSFFPLATYTQPHIFGLRRFAHVEGAFKDFLEKGSEKGFP